MIDLIDLTCSIWFGLIDLIVVFDDWFEGGFVGSIVNLIDWFIQGYFTRSPLVHSLVNYWYIRDHYIIPTDHFTHLLVNHWYITRQPLVHISLSLVYYTYKSVRGVFVINLARGRCFLQIRDHYIIPTDGSWSFFSSTSHEVGVFSRFGIIIASQRTTSHAH